MFIALYGINNVGKSYHAKRLVRHLRKLGHKVKYLKYPIYDLPPTGPLLNSILRSKSKQSLSEYELQLVFVLNRYHFQPKLLKYLEHGYTVVAEDYIGTGLAWGITKGADQAELEMMNKFLVQEDLSILIEGERGLHAKESRHIHEADDALVEKCQNVLKRLAKQKKWHVVRRQKNKDETAQLIWNICERALAK